MGVSQREYSRMRGVSLAAVQKAIKSGRIKLNSKGLVDPDQANADWQQNTNPARGKFKEEPQFSQQSSAHSFSSSSLNDTPKVSGGYQQVRTAKEYYSALYMKERLRKYKEELVEKSKVNEHIFKLGRNLRDGLMLLPTRDCPAIAAQLNIDEQELRNILDERIRAFLTEYGDLTTPL